MSNARKLGQVVAGGVEYPLVASQAEMETGTEANTRIMSPLRVAQAISGRRQTIPAIATVIIDKGTVGTGTVTFNGSLADYQRLQVSGALTIAFSNLPAAGTTEGIVIELVNGGSAAVTMPTCTWIKSDGSTSATFSDMAVTLQTSGTNWLVFWLNTAGTLCGKIAR